LAINLNFGSRHPAPGYSTIWLCHQLPRAGHSHL